MPSAYLVFTCPEVLPFAFGKVNPTSVLLFRHRCNKQIITEHILVFDAIGLRISGVVHHKCAHRWNTLGVVFIKCSPQSGEKLNADIQQLLSFTLTIKLDPWRLLTVPGVDQTLSRENGGLQPAKKILFAASFTHLRCPEQTGET